MRPADHSSRGFLPNVVCLTTWDPEASIMRRPWPTGGPLCRGKKSLYSRLRRIMGNERLNAADGRAR